MRSALICAALLVWVVSCGVGHAQGGGTNTLVMLNCEDTGSMQQVVQRIQAHGGVVRHIFPTHLLIAELPDTAAQALSRDSRIDLIAQGYVDPDAVPNGYGRMAADAVAAWNQVYVRPEPAPEEAPEGMLARPLVDDALLAPDEGLRLRAGVAGALAPPGAASWQTSEYMMGNVVVSVVFLESNGSVDPQTENWTPAEQSQVVSECLAGANWWISQYPYSVAPLSFTWEYHYAVPTGYEPINRSSGDDILWIADALTALGWSCTPATAYATARNYDNALRNSYGADWAYTVFVVDSSVDADGMFTDGYFAYAYIGGPYLVMTYDNDGWGISNMDRVLAHETGHIFRAGDEYCQAGYSCCSSSAYYGYLRVQNTNCSTGVTCIMNTNAWAVCSVTKQQLGWRDTDIDGRPDILDVNPTATLNPYAPDPTNDTTPTYTGSASVGYYPNQLYPGSDVTLNRIANVEYRVDSGSWQNCTPIDGAFNGGTESYTFTPAPLAAGLHTFEVRATDTSGNVTPAPYPSDSLTINAHTVTVTASAFPTTVSSGGSTSLSATFSDSQGHGAASWAWNDGGAGGSFSQSNVQNPTYTAPVNITDNDIIVTLTVTVTCDGPSPVSDSDSTSLAVEPVPHTLSVTASAVPSTVGSGGSSTLGASYTDSHGHGIATWAWDDGGAGGSLSQSNVQNPTYTAPVNTTDNDIIVTLTVTATCNGPIPISDTDSTSLTVQPVPHTLTVTASAVPSTVGSGGSSTLGASYTDSHGHGIATWSWGDGGAGGSFSPSANVQNPTYTAPANTTDNNIVITLTATATCNGPSPISNSGSASLTVQPVPHTLSVTASAVPSTVGSGGSSNLSALYSDSHNHGIATWAWDDGGVGGSFSPSANVQNPTYTAPANTTDSDIIVTLTVTATCNGPIPISDSDSTSLTVQPVPHTLSVTASAVPSTVGSGGSTSLSASYTDSHAHGIATWAWDDEGAGGSFSPSASVQNPSYTAPANTGETDITVTLTVTATCNGPSPINDSDAIGLTVARGSGHILLVTASGTPDTVASGGTSNLSASYTDSQGHGIATWAWDDGGAGGTFSPSANVQNPTYSAPANTGDTDIIVTLTVTATCDGPSPISDSDATSLTVHPVTHVLSVTASAVPTTVASGGTSELGASYTDSHGHGIATWAWNDGGAGGSFDHSNVQNPTYTAPANAGGSDLFVTLTVTGTCDGPDPQSDSGSVILMVPPPPAADFSASPLRGKLPLPVEFTDESIGPPLTWSWDFGDGGASTDQDPAYEYQTAGHHDVSLTVTDAFGTGTETKAKMVAVSFRDVPIAPEDPADYWAVEYILGCVDAATVQGYPDGTYRPTEPVDRGQMAVYVARSVAGGEASVPSGPAEATFTDVPTDHWAFRYIEYAASQNVVIGYDDGTYRPDEDVTRGQMAVFIARAVVAPTDRPDLLSYTPPDTPTFPDVPADYWSYKFVEYLVAEDIVRGYDDGSYRPEEVVTRDQMAVYVAKAFSLLD